MQVGKNISIETFINNKHKPVLLDVRSPHEYDKGHIPGALNLPLFTNEERIKIGTLYKQVSPEKALLEGLAIAGRKMKWYVEQAQMVCPEKKVVVHCWRGGKRSQSIGWLLSMAGFDVKILIGGYKKYRNYLHQYFENQHTKFIVLGGQTGIGKTIVLHHLQKMGEQIIDLEALAHHKGSAFGSLGESEQPSTEQFENNLFEIFNTLNKSKCIFIENESALIGTCRVPPAIMSKMKQYVYIQYSIPMDERIEILIKNYACYSKHQLAERFLKIKNKIGGNDLNIALTALEENKFEVAAKIALKFYDKTYHFGYEKNTTPQKFILEFEHANTMQIAQEIQKMCITLNL